MKINEIQQRDCPRISVLVLFSTFSYDIGKRMDSKISRFVDDTKHFKEGTIFAIDKGLHKTLEKRMSGQKGQLSWVCWGTLQAGARGP